MIDDLGDNILEFQLFTDKFCKEAIALAEVLDKWTIDRHEFYPTNDVLLPELGLDAIYSRVLKEVIYPLCIHYWKLEGTQWHNMQSENFLARYTTDRQSHLSLHHDFSHITMVVKLNDEFEGGGTWFPKYGVLSNPKNVGVATLHPGMVTHLHGARPISAGEEIHLCIIYETRKLKQLYMKQEIRFNKTIGDDGHLVSPVLNEGCKNYLIDIDGTVTDDVPNEEPERMSVVQPYNGAVETLNRWYDEGHVITFFTSRTEEVREITETWLDKHGFKYHGLLMGKPRGGNYHWIDNHIVRGTRYNGVWSDLVEKEVTIEVFQD